MSNVPWTNLNPNALQVVLLDPSTGEMYAAGAGSIGTDVHVLDSALPAGAATSAKQDTLLASIGSPSDVAWSGTGDGTVISILKAIALNTTL